MDEDAIVRESVRLDRLIARERSHRGEIAADGAFCSYSASAGMSLASDCAGRDTPSMSRRTLPSPSPDTTNASTLSGCTDRVDLSR